MRHGGVGARPVHHRAGVERHMRAVQNFGQHEPVGCGPVAGIAERDDLHGAGLLWQLSSDSLQRGHSGQGAAARLKPMQIVEVQRAGQGAGATCGGGFFAAQVESLGAGVQQQRAWVAEIARHLGPGGEQGVVELRGERAGRRCGRGLAGERQCGGLPGGHAAVENGEMLQSQPFERPVHAGGCAEIAGIIPAGDEHHGGFRVQAQSPHESGEPRQRQELARIAGGAAPVGIGRGKCSGNVRHVGRCRIVAEVDDAHLRR